MRHDTYDNNVLFGETRIFLVHELELFHDNAGPDNERDRDHELENNQYVAKAGTQSSSLHVPFEDISGSVRRE